MVALAWLLLAVEAAKAIPAVGSIDLKTATEFVERYADIGTVEGVALDLDALNDPIDIHLYLGAPYSSGTHIATHLADAFRQDLADAGLPPNHGFSFLLPESASVPDHLDPTTLQVIDLRNGQPHRYFIHGIDANQEPGGNALLEPSGGFEYSWVRDDAFSFIILPDTQYYSDWDEGTYYAQSDWIVDRKADLNIQFVIHMGDITNDDTEEEWQFAQLAHQILDSNMIPYSVIPGNHDYRQSDGDLTRDESRFNDFFPPGPAVHSNVSERGHFPPGRNQNNYALLEPQGLPVMIMSLEFSPTKDAMCWAGDVIDQHPDRRVIVATHCYATNDGELHPKCGKAYNINGATGQMLWDELLSRHPNVFMALSGHVTESEYVARPRGMTWEPVHEILTDYQKEEKNGEKHGQGWLRVMAFDPARDEINVSIASARDKATLNYDGDDDPPPYSHDPRHEDHQFSIDYNFSAPFAGQGEPRRPIDSFRDRTVNGKLSGDQQRPAVARNANGDIAVVWEDDLDDEFDEEEVMLRAFDREGCELFPPIRVNDDTDGGQRKPSVAVTENGQIIVVYEADFNDDDKYNVVARGYDWSGNPTIPQFVVNTDTSDDQLNPDVAATPDGGFVVVWEDDANGNNSFGIRARGFNGDGTQRFPQIQVNDATDGNQRNAAVATDAIGGFVVVFESDEDGNGSYGVRMRGFDENGFVRIPEFDVESDSADDQVNPDVAIVPGGDIVVVFQDDSQGDFDIRARLFSLFGTPIGPDFVVNDVDSHDQTRPAVDVNSNGAFVVAWEGDDDNDGKTDVRLRFFDAEGDATSSDQVVPLNEVGDQRRPAIASDGEGSVIVAWGDDMNTNGKFDVLARTLPRSPNVIGAVDVARAGEIVGWTVEVGDPDEPTEVEIYVGGPKGFGTYLGTITADEPRPDVNAMGYLGDHGFRYQIPLEYQDGGSYTFYLYGVDSNGESSANLLEAGGTAWTQEWILTDDQRREYMYYYAPVIFKRAEEGSSGHWGNDWITNFDFDRNWDFSDNKKIWEEVDDYVASSPGAPDPVDYQGPRDFLSWQIRPTLYASIIEFMEDGQKSIVILYHIYHAKQQYSIHDWERIEIRVDGVTGTPGGAGEDPRFVVVTEHHKHAGRSLGSNDLNFMETATGRHPMIWQADWNVDGVLGIAGATKGFYGAELHFVEVPFSWVDERNSEGNEDAEVEVNGDGEKKNVHYVFVPRASQEAVDYWGAEAITYQNAYDMASKSSTAITVDWDEVPRVTYEIQDLADIIPTHWIGGGYETHWKNDNLVIWLESPMLGETGAVLVPEGPDYFITESQDDEDGDESRDGYPDKGWLWGGYNYGGDKGVKGRFFSGNVSNLHEDRSLANLRPDSLGGGPWGTYWWQHDYFAHSGIKGTSNFEYGSWLYADWYTPSAGGFDGRWVALFDDELECGDGIDNDNDGYFDLDDPGCDTIHDGSERGNSCNDYVDNDGDGGVDHRDDRCSEGAVAESTIMDVTDCFDGLDNDLDGNIDFPDDPKCGPEAGYWKTVFETYLQCDNGVDDDGDGRIDMADPHCTHIGIGVEEPECSDGKDNDYDGLADASDPDCVGNPDGEREWGDWVPTPGMPAEVATGCGMGWELAPAMLVLLFVRRRRLLRRG